VTRLLIAHLVLVNAHHFVESSTSAQNLGRTNSRSTFSPVSSFGIAA
jgi:hypothetical protein